MEPNDVWGWAGGFSDAVHRRAKLSELRSQIATVVCGDCDKWMKSSQCPRERHDNRIGRYVGPSSHGAICDKFIEAASSSKLRAERRTEMQRPEGTPPAAAERSDEGKS